jgi:hypothetical protein
VPSALLWLMEVLGALLWVAVYQVTNAFTAKKGVFLELLIFTQKVT